MFKASVFQLKNPTQLFAFLIISFFVFGKPAFSQENEAYYIKYIDLYKEQDSTKRLFDISTKALIYSKKTNNNLLQSKSIEALANIYNQIGEHQKAMEKGFELLTFGEKLNNSELIVTGNVIIGSSLFYLDEDLKGISYYKKAEQLLLKEGADQKKLIEIQGNIGTLYTQLPHKMLEDLDTALFYYAKSNIDSIDNSVTTKANHYFNVGSLYVQKNRYAPSEENFQKALSNYDSAIHYFETSKDLDRLGKCLTNKAKLFYDSKLNDKALSVYLQAVQHSLKSNDYNSLLMQYDYIRYLYELKGKTDSAYQYRENWVSISDSLNKYEAIQNASELEVKYETEKKEQENLLLSKENEKKQLGIYFSIGGLVLLSGLVFMIYRNSKQKTKANNLLSAQKEIIEDQNKSITDSIKYAQRIQGAILPPDKMWFAIFPDSFVLYKPKDILSGDFYWVEETEDWKFVAAADCTGHGVPGALMSIVNFNLLNKAVLEKKLCMPGEILDSVNEQLTQALHQTYQESTVKDGMDITILSINKKSNEVYFAGANNPIYILGKEKDAEIRGNKFPVGAFVGETIQNFTTHKLDVQKGDRVFLFSDGYADQFGGPKGKKFKYKQMKECILKSLQFSQKDQKEFLNKTYDDWRGDFEQVDDVLVIGLNV